MPKLFGSKPMTEAQADGLEFQMSVFQRVLIELYPGQIFSQVTSQLEKENENLKRDNAAEHLKKLSEFNKMLVYLVRLKHQLENKLGIFAVKEPVELLAEYRSSVELMLQDTLKLVSQNFLNDYSHNVNTFKLTSAKMKDIKLISSSFQAITNVIEQPTPQNMQKLLNIEPALEKRISSGEFKEFAANLLAIIATVAIVVGIICLLNFPLVGLGIIGLGVACIPASVLVQKQRGADLKSAAKVMQTKMLPAIDKLFKSPDTTKALKAAEKNVRRDYDDRRDIYIDPVTRFFQTPERPQPFLAFLH
jgi:hypothetical protein